MSTDLRERAAKALHNTKLAFEAGLTLEGCRDLADAVLEVLGAPLERSPYEGLRDAVTALHIAFDRYADQVSGADKLVETDVRDIARGPNRSFSVKRGQP